MIVRRDTYAIVLTAKHVLAEVQDFSVSFAVDPNRQLPVRWTDEVLGIAERLPDALYVEMGPGSVLVGLVKKIAPALRTQTCGSAAEVEQLLELVT